MRHSVPDPEDIARWIARFRRALDLYAPEYEADGFNDLVSIAVCGVTLEALIGIGLRIEDHGIDLEFATLGKHVKLALKSGVVSNTLKPILEEFTTMRNAFAHEIDYRLTGETALSLAELLPAKFQDNMRSAVQRFGGDSPPAGTHLRLTMMTMIEALYEDMQANLTALLAKRAGRRQVVSRNQRSAH